MHLNLNCCIKYKKLTQLIHLIISLFLITDPFIILQIQGCKARIFVISEHIEGSNVLTTTLLHKLFYRMMQKQ